MDFINGGELFHHLSIEKRFSEERARFYVAEIVSGMEYLHKAGVIYRDLKPENLLLNGQGHIVMTDFGLSKEGLHAKDARTATFCGTPEYLAPEIIKGDNYTKAIDWWSVGTLLYEMLTGLPPFYTEDEENMYHKIMTADLVIPPFFSPEVADLIKQFLIREPTQRLQDPLKIRSHPFFASINWEKLESLQIVPPFKPEVKSEEDVRNIDDEFLQEDVDAVDEDDEPKGGVKKDEFMGFTFANNEAPVNRSNRRSASKVAISNVFLPAWTNQSQKRNEAVKFLDQLKNACSVKQSKHRKSAIALKPMFLMQQLEGTRWGLCHQICRNTSLTRWGGGQRISRTTRTGVHRPLKTG
jgi:serine/threonine protein kinase